MTTKGRICAPAALASVAASALLATALAGPAAADGGSSVRWKTIVGIEQAANVVGGVGGGGQPWTTLGGEARVDLASGNLEFEVRGLVLAGGNTIGTPDGIAQVKGTLVCDAGAADQAVVDTPLVTLSARVASAATASTASFFCSSARTAMATLPAAQSSSNPAATEGEDWRGLADPERLRVFPRRLGRREADVAQVALAEARELRAAARPPAPFRERAADTRGRGRASAGVPMMFPPQPRRGKGGCRTGHGDAPHLRAEQSTRSRCQIPSACRWPKRHPILPILGRKRPTRRA